MGLGRSKSSLEGIFWETGWFGHKVWRPFFDHTPLAATYYHPNYVNSWSTWLDILYGLEVHCGPGHARNCPKQEQQRTLGRKIPFPTPKWHKDTPEHNFRYIRELEQDMDIISFIKADGPYLATFFICYLSPLKFARLKFPCGCNIFWNSHDQSHKSWS